MLLRPRSVMQNTHSASVQSDDNNDELVNTRGIIKACVCYFIKFLFFTK